MRIALLLDGVSQDCVKSVLLDHANVVKSLPDDVPMMLDAFDVMILKAGAADMEDTLDRAVNRQWPSYVSPELKQLVKELMGILTRPDIPNNYVFRVYPLPFPQVALVYDKEKFDEFHRQFSSK